MVLALQGRLFLLSFKHCELGRRQGAKARVRPAVVVIEPPCFNRLACFGEREKHVFVEAFVTQAAVERFDESVLNRLAGLDVVPAQPPGGPT